MSVKIMMEYGHDISFSKYNPLSREEQEELKKLIDLIPELEKKRQTKKVKNKLKKCLQARKKLIETNVRSVISSIQRYKISLPFDEVVAICNFELVKKIHLWDPERGTISTFIYAITRNIIRELLLPVSIIKVNNATKRASLEWDGLSDNYFFQGKSFKKENLKKALASLRCAPLTSETDQVFEVFDENSLEIQERKEGLYQLLSILSKDEREAIEKIEGLNGYTPASLKKLAREKGLSRQGISNRYCRAIKKMRKYARTSPKLRDLFQL